MSLYNSNTTFAKGDITEQVNNNSDNLLILNYVFAVHKDFTQRRL